MRFLFYGIIILIVLLLIVIIDQVVYWSCRIFVTKHTAQVIHWSFTLTLIAVTAVASTWGHYFTRFSLEVHPAEVVSAQLPEAFDGYRIVQISDLHLDSFDQEEGEKFFSQLIESIQAQQPDLIVFTGDLVSRQSSEAEPFRDFLYRLAHLPKQGDSLTCQEGNYIPVYSVLGNHDYADYTPMSRRERVQDMQHLCQLQEEAGWHLLRNESVRLQRGEEEIALLGVENIGEPPFSTYGDLSKAMKGVSDSLFQILLSHNPTHWRREVLPNTHIDLMLAGHTHAVQLQIGSWSPAKWKYAEWSGLYSQTCADSTDVNAQRTQYLYVNTGIGGVGPRVRIGIAPEVTLLTLKKGH